ncbi:MAG: reverse transcriptase-like protein [Deltaproteobacteria bacterium]|nr:reverse transcriptase-like protein [Candidatus Zymogenaceae bacterium]
MGDRDIHREAVALLKRLAKDDAARIISEFLGNTECERTSELLGRAAESLEASFPTSDAVRTTPGKAAFSAYVDGASSGNPGPSGIGGVLYDENGDELERFSEHIGAATNNVAEYRALIHALGRLRNLGAEHVRVFTDSQLLQRQTTGDWKIKDEKLRELNRTLRDIIDRFSSFEITHIGREKNRLADRLAKRAAER